MGFYDRSPGAKYAPPKSGKMKTTDERRGLVVKVKLNDKRQQILELQHDFPLRLRVPTSWVRKAIKNGWVTGEKKTHLTSLGGREKVPESKAHNFTHYEFLVLHTTLGDIRYRVTHQPGRYLVKDDDPNRPPEQTRGLHVAGAVPARVDWFYEAELILGV